MVSFLLLAGCSIPVFVRNTPARPVPTAPMGETVQQEDGTQRHNPQLGPPPDARIYEAQPFPFMRAVGQAMAGNWIGLAGTVIAAVAGGGMVQQRRRRQMAEADRDRLAEQDPDKAKAELEVIKRRG